MLDEKQKELELQKWFDSEKAGKDTCGSYDYCKNCDKSLVDPCATAYEKTIEPAVELIGVKVVKPATKKAPAKKTACKTATKATATKTVVKTTAKKTAKK